MATKERYSNPNVDDTVILRLVAFQCQLPASIIVIDVDIYYLDPNNRSEDNPDGRCFIETVSGAVEDSCCPGQYYVEVLLERPQYQIGKYVDIWNVNTDSNEDVGPIENKFEIFPSIFSSDAIPPVFDFDFKFQPNRIRLGEKKYLMAEVIPIVPTASDLERYYQNLAITPDLCITIELVCGACVPTDPDSRRFVDEEPMDFREKRHGFFLLDTENLDMVIGIYDVWFTMHYCGNKYLSDKMSLQVFD